MYCSQVVWDTWNPDRGSGVDLDATWWPVGQWQSIHITLFIPVTYMSTLPWPFNWIVLAICVVLPIVMVIWTLVQIDIVYPWDIVIDDNTREVMRWY